MTIHLIMDGKRIEATDGQTVLEAARVHGIVIPTLCYHKDLSPISSCRLCVVEVEGRRGEVAACSLPVSEGMVVQTETLSLLRSRRTILEMLLANYYDAGYLPADRDDTEFIRLVNQYLPESSLRAATPRRWRTARCGEPRGVSGSAQRFLGALCAPRNDRTLRINSDPNPFIWVDLNKCILCTRCVRACAEMQGRFVWRTDGRGAETFLVAGLDTTMLEARCESCGACAAFCPTGALDDKMAIDQGKPDRLVTTTCTYCGVGCQFDLNVKNGKIVRVTSNPNAPVNGMALCVKGRYGYDFVHHSDRVLRPLVREYLLQDDGRRTADDGGQSSAVSRRGQWVEVDWDTALSITARKLSETRRVHGPDSIGLLTSAKCLNEENYLMNKFARQVIGTNNIDHCARL